MDDENPIKDAIIQNLKPFAMLEDIKKLISDNKKLQDENDIDKDDDLIPITNIKEIV